MYRRDTLRRCAGLGATGGVGLLAGCAVGGEDAGPSESASLSVETFDYREGDAGNFVVTVTVENSGRAEGTGDLYLTVTAAEPTSEGEKSGNGTATETDDGDDTVTAREVLDVTVPAGETETVEVPFEFTVEQFERDGSLDIDLRE